MTQVSCSTSPDLFLQPGERADWHRSSAAKQARQLCAKCPLGAVRCAQQALELPGIPDGVILAGIVCRGGNATRHELRLLAGAAKPRTDRPNLTLVPATPATHCTGCERPFADPDSPPDPDSDAVHRSARGLCRSCYTAARRAGTLEPAHAPRPDDCIDCDKPMVAARQPIPAGHVRHEKAGRCETCNRRHSYQPARKDAAA